MASLGLDRELDQLLALTTDETRYVDLCLVLRRPMVHLRAAPGTMIQRDAVFVADGVTLRPCMAPDVRHVFVPASGELALAMSSAPEDIGASARLMHGVALAGPAGIAATFAPVELLRGGGSWDRLRNTWERERPPVHPMVIDLEEPQVEFVAWFAGWLHAYRTGAPREDSAAFVYGGRRGGKTFSALLCLIAAMLEVPDSLGWAVSVSHVERDVDIDRNVKRLIPSDWYFYREHPSHKYFFVNGSTITNISADDPEGSKRGQVDIVLINEGAKMRNLVYENSLGGTIDRGGIVLVVSNPPRSTKGEWVEVEVTAAAEAVARGQEPDARVFKVDPDQNRAINQRSRSKVKRILERLDPAMAEADSDGIMRPVGDRALYAWDKIKHALRPGPPDIGDVTTAFTRAKCGRPYEYILGVDFQKRPAIAGTLWRLFGSQSEPVMWCVGAFLVEGAEDDFLDVLDADGRYHAQNTIVVADATGVHQNFAHEQGKTSWGPFNARGWHVEGPEKKTKWINPRVEISLGQFNRLLTTGRVHVQPDLAVNVILRGGEKLLQAEGVAVAFKEARAEKGTHGLTMRRGDKHAHLVDTGRYVGWWIEPPREVARTGVRLNRPAAHRR